MSSVYLLPAGSIPRRKPVAPLSLLIIRDAPPGSKHNLSEILAVELTVDDD